MEERMTSKKGSENINTQIRKQENSLAISGLAVIAFGIWTVIKTGLMLLISPEEFNAQFDIDELTQEIAEADDITAGILTGAAAAGIIIAMAIDLFIRLKVGMAARKEGMGGKKMGKGKIVLAVILSLILMTSVVGGTMEIINSGLDDSMDTRMIAVLIDLTALSACVHLLYSARRLRKLRKEI